MDRLYRRFPSLLMARRNIARTKVRSVLAALGIVIGVIAIASLGMFGLTLQYQISQNLGDLANQVTVQPTDSVGLNGGLSEREVRDVQRIAGPSASVVPVNRQVMDVAFDRGEPAGQSVIAVESPASLYEARDGTIPENFRSGVLVGETLAEEHDLDPGSSIAVNGSNMRVNAILAAGDTVGFLPSDRAVVVPTTQFDQRRYDEVIVITEDTQAANETAMALREGMNDRRERVEVQDNSDIADQLDQTFQTLNIFLIGIGSISLLVAGVSILNVMLMSTVERREEIGVMRAVGFQRLDVLKIMLSEAVLLGVIGGIVGIGFSLVAGMVINHFMVGNAMLAFRPANLPYVALAFVFGAGTSLLSGLYPAWKAANERPVDALRS